MIVELRAINEEWRVCSCGARVLEPPRGIRRGVYTLFNTADTLPPWWWDHVRNAPLDQLHGAGPGAHPQDRAGLMRVDVATIRAYGGEQAGIKVQYWWASEEGAYAGQGIARTGPGHWSTSSHRVPSGYFTIPFSMAYERNLYERGIISARELREAMGAA